MLNLYSTDKLDVERYYALLTEKGFIYVNVEKLHDDVTFMGSRVSSLASTAIRHMQVTQKKMVSDLSDVNVYDYLVDGCGVNPSSLRAKNVRGWSIDEKRLSRLSDRKMVADFLEIYQAYKSSKTKKGIIAGIRDRAQPTEERSPSGARLGKVFFQVEPRQNLRYYYKKESIVQIPRAMSGCVTVPEGYFLTWGDFASADMIAALNCYLIDTDRDREIAALHGKDGYAMFAHLISEFYGEPFDKEAFLENRAAYKLYALKTIYGNTYGATEEESLFIKRAIPYLNSKPRYVKYRETVKRAYEAGLPIEVESYFGHTQFLDRTAANSTLTEVTDKALNTPIQTHTSERIIALVLSVVGDFERLGYRYGEDFWVYYIRHDEPLFLFKNEMLKDVWVLKDNAEVQVDDGIVQYVDWVFGYEYKSADAKMQETVEKIYEANKARMRKPAPRARAEKYLPVKDTLVIGVAMRSFGDDLVVAIYVENDNSVAYKKYQGLGDSPSGGRLDVLQEVLLRRLQKGKVPRLGTVLVYNDLTADPLYDDGVYFATVREYGTPFLRARALCEWTCGRVAQRDGIPFESQQDFDEEALAWMKGVGASDVFI